MVLLYLLCLSTSASAAIIRAYHEESPTCGKLGSLREPRIVGGREVFQGEIPWIVSLQNGGIHFCGGALISEKHVLTAAHCFDSNGHKYSLNNMTVVAGAHRRSAIDETRTSIIKIKKVTLHKNYVSMAHYHNDIAILELSESIQWSSYVKPICLPKTDVPTGLWATVSGWGDMWGDNRVKAVARQGMDSMGESNSVGDVIPQAAQYYSDTLMTVNLTIFENSYCNKLYGSCNSTLTLTDTQICAGTVANPNGEATDDKDAAQGDSGGPLAVLLNGRWTIAAIVSVKPSKFKAPAIYSRVSSYLTWIQETIQD